MRREVVGREVIFYGESELGAAVAWIDIERRGVLAIDEVVEGALGVSLLSRAVLDGFRDVCMKVAASYVSKCGPAARDCGRHVGLRTIEVVLMLDERSSLKSSCS